MEEIKVVARPRKLAASWTIKTREDRIRESAYYLYLHRTRLGIAGTPEIDWMIAEQYHEWVDQLNSRYQWINLLRPFPALQLEQPLSDIAVPDRVTSLATPRSWDASEDELACGEYPAPTTSEEA